MKTLSILLFLLLSGHLAISQIFDYGTFSAATSEQSVQVKDQFTIKNFDACWNITFKYSDGKSKTIRGVDLAPLIFSKDKEVIIKVIEDRTHIQSDYGSQAFELPEMEMKFIPMKTNDITECNNINTKKSTFFDTFKFIDGVKNEPKKNIEIPSIRNPFYDAILLQEMVIKNKKESITALLSLYGIDKVNISDIEPLSDYQSHLFPDSQDSLLVTKSVKDPVNLTQAAGSTFVTALTEALAQFIAKRVKEELTLAYLSRFRAFLEEKNQSIQIGVLLPESYKVMTEVEPYDYTTFWLAMQEGFQDDVAQFPENTMGFVRVHKERFKSDDSYAATLTGLYLLRGTYRKYSAVAILDSLESLPEVKSFTSDNVSASLRTLSLLSRNLHHLENKNNVESESKGWVKPNELVALANKQTRDFFAGLLLAKEKEALASIQFKTNSNLSLSLRSIVLSNYKNPEFIKTLIEMLTQLNALLEQEKQVGKESDKIEDEDNAKKKVRTTFEKYETYARTFLNLVDNSGEWVRKLTPKNPEIAKAGQTLAKYSVITRTSIDLTKHMSEKRYNLAFFDVVKLLKELQLNNFKDTLNTSVALDGNTKLQQLLEKNKSDLGITGANLTQLTTAQLDIAKTKLKSIPRSDKRQIKAFIQTLDSYTNWEWEKIVKYGSFISNVAGADSAAQIVAALEAAALPAGSYQIKHENRFTVSLNAYGGLNYSCEVFNRVRGTSDLMAPGKDTINSSYILSAYAPVGMSLSWGLKKQWIESLSLFIPVIDVGAAFALRFKNDLKTLPDQLSWDNILAPGIHLVAGFRNSPLTFSAGAQYGAGLRKLEYDKGAKPIPFSAQSVWYGVTLSVDVPIFTLHIGKGYTRKNQI